LDKTGWPINKKATVNPCKKFFTKCSIITNSTGKPYIYISFTIIEIKYVKKYD